MKRSVLFVIAALGAGAAAVRAVPSATKASGPPPVAGAAAQRGKYLVSVLACGDCHTPKKMGPNGPEADESRLLAGYVDEKLPAPPPTSGPWIAQTTGQQTAWAGPWGVSFSKNLTPDQNTGIGSWSEETFVKAIRTGRHMGVSRPILPPMPWDSYRNLTDADLKAVYAYLRSIPPVRNPQPDPVAPPAAPGK